MPRFQLWLWTRPLPATQPSSAFLDWPLIQVWSAFPWLLSPADPHAWSWLECTVWSLLELHSCSCCPSLPGPHVVRSWSILLFQSWSGGWACSLSATLRWGHISFARSLGGSLTVGEIMEPKSATLVSLTEQLVVGYSTAPKETLWSSSYLFENKEVKKWNSLTKQLMANAASKVFSEEVFFLLRLVC